MKVFLVVLLFPVLILASEIKSDSFFQINTEWQNQDGKTVQFKDFQGHPVVLSMVYMTCPFLCPTITSDIQRIELKLSEKQKKNTRFVLVSFDPERDTPKKMKAFMKKHKLDSERWVLLSSKKEPKLRELAGIMNFKYQKLEDGEFSHSYIIQALDKDGIPAARIEGANQDIKPFAEALSKL